MSATLRSIEEEGSTYDEAINKALEKLAISLDRVNIEIIEVKKTGLFIRKSLVKIRATEKEVINEDEKKEKAEYLLNKILNHMNVDHHIGEVREGKEKIYIDLNSQDEGIIIGKWGQTINSVQYLLNLLYNKDHVVKKRIVLNVGQYRKRREIMLKNMAQRFAEQAKETKKEVVLDPMPAEDRKIIHTTLENLENIRTSCIGNGEFRSIVISFSPQKNSNH